MHTLPPDTGPLPPLFDAERLLRASPAQLRRLHYDVFGHYALASNARHLLRKIAWELQARREGRLPDAARDRALWIARHSVLRTRPEVSRSATSPTNKAESSAHHDPRLPRAGSCLVRTFGERRIVVKVLASGFEFDGRPFASLSAIAREVTGTRWNGFVFFGLQRPYRPVHPAKRPHAPAR